MFREVTPVSHISLKSGVGKRSHAEWTLLNLIDSSTKGFLEILSNVSVAQERSLPFTYGRPDESCSSLPNVSSLTQGKPDKLVLEPSNFADDRVRYCYDRKEAIFENWPDTLSVNL